MSLLEAARLALAQIRVQKLKSFFTLLGVTVGVMFLIGVVSIVEGMGQYVEKDFAGKFLGVNTMTLRRFPDFNSGNVSDATWREWQRRPQISIQDAEAVRTILPADVHWAIQDVRWASPHTRYVSGGPQVLAQAVTPGYFGIKNLDLSEGRVFNRAEDALGSPVAVIGTEVAKFYFPGLDPIGKTIRFQGLPYRVIGLLKKQGTVFGISLDRQVLAPFHSPMQRVTGARIGLYGVLIQAPTAAALADVQESVRELMRTRHQLHPADSDNFDLETPQSALSQWETIKRFLVLAGILLPAIGLVVGAIVIMNIMLMAVSERTHEIGIRKSLGARRRDIMAQFLVESATLSVLGAIVGIGLGIALGEIVALVSPLPAHVAPWSLGVAVALGAGIGVIAGMYPASRAARLDPIIALRAE